jgi:hypothetical protein
MALETGTFISDLVVANPTGSDALAFADDHLRLIKTTVKNTFPNVTGAVTKTHTQLNNAVDKTGDTMTGFLTLSGAPTADLHAATKKFVEDTIAAAKVAQYPVGSIYINATNATNPSSLLGFGTWVAFGAGRVPVGFDASDTLFNAAEETGGSKDAVVVSHTHTFTGTTNTTGAHQHELKTSGSVNVNINDNESFTGDTGTLRGTTATAGNHSHTVSGTTDSSGVSGTNANLQPYITVYMWKRTA